MSMLISEKATNFAFPQRKNRIPLMGMRQTVEKVQL